MNQNELDQIRRNVNEGPTPYVNMAGLVAEAVEVGHVRLRLPVDPVHKNHVGIAYAGSEFVLAEIAGGTLFMTTYGTDEFVPILKGVDIKFLKPGTTDLIVDVSLDEEQAEERIAPIRERGRGDFMLDIEVLDEDGQAVATFAFNYYALPARK